MRWYEFSQTIFTNKGKIAVFVMVIMASVPFIQAFSTFVPGTFAIHLDRDDAITTASNTLLENIPEMHILEYGSLKYQLLAHRIIQPLIWIGHGNKEGITINNALSSWEEFSEDLQHSHSFDVVLSCFSKEIIKQTSLTQKDVLTFKGEIDAKLGSYLISYLLTGSDIVLSKVFMHYQSLQQGKTQYQPLHVFDPGQGGSGSNINLPSAFDILKSMTSNVFLDMSGIELFYHILMLFVLIIQILLVVYVMPFQFSFLEFAAIDLFAAGIMQLLIAFAFYSAGGMTLEKLTSSLFGIILDALGCLFSAIFAAPAWEIAVFVALTLLGGAILLVQFFADATTGGVATFIRIGTTILLVGIYIANFMVDLLDNDYVVG